MGIGDNIKRLRESRNLSQKDIAEIAGVTDKAVSSWETGNKVPRMGVIQKLADYFGVAKSQIIEDQQDIPGFVTFPVTQFYRIPVVGSVRAGFGGYAHEELEGYEMADVRHPEEHFFLRVAGDSMAPMINEGELALIHTQPDVESGEVAVVIINGDEGMIKKVVKGKDGIILQSFNPEYLPRLVAGRDLADMMIVGKVVMTQRRW